MVPATLASTRALIGCCAPRTEHLSDGPCLSNTAVRRERRVPVEDLAQGSQSVRGNLLAQRFQEAQRSFTIFVHTQMRQHKRSDQPSPHRTLVVGAIALRRTAAVMSLISRIAWREAAESVGRQQIARAGVYYSFLLFGGERTTGQRNSENLVGPEGNVVSNSRRVNHVVATRGGIVPKLLETLFC